MDALRQTYRYIESYHASRSVMPTQREIGEAFGITANAAQRRLRRLEEMGWITMGGNRAIVLRGIPQGDPQGL